MAASESKPDAAPAHALWVELATRITTQRLHYRSGDEETAAASVAQLFGVTRKLMTENREATAFQAVALKLLNRTLRPYTARWHGWMTAHGNRVNEDGKPILRFRDEWVRRKFREELMELQPHLLGFQKTLERMKDGATAEANWLELEQNRSMLEALADECRAASATAWMGEQVVSRLRPQVTLRAAVEEGLGELISPEIARQETAAIWRRRRLLVDSAMRKSIEVAPPAELTDVSAIALSGGGIRSATFCLGIVQALQAHRLFEKFDYLSTVSGGGYLGSFLSSYLGGNMPERNDASGGAERGQSGPAEISPEQAAADDDKAAAEARKRLDDTFREPESDSSESLAIRHLRNNSRYLLNGGGWGLIRIGGVFLTGFLTSLLMLLTLPLVAAWLLRFGQDARCARFLGTNLWLLQPWRSLALVGLTVGALVAIAVDFRRWLFLSAASFLGLLWGTAAVRALGLKLVFGLGQPLPEPWPHPGGVAFAGAVGILAIFWLLMPIVQRFAQGAKWDSGAARARSLSESCTLLTGIAAMLIGLVWASSPIVEAYESLRAGLQNAAQHLGVWRPPEFLTTALLGAVPAVFGALTKRKDGSLRRWAQWLFFLTAPAFFLLAFLVFASHLGLGHEQDWKLGWAFAVTGAVLAWVFVFLNINTFAPLCYYRDRLCECYLAISGCWQRSWLTRMFDRFVHGLPDCTANFTGVGTLQRLPLSSLGACAAAPYHLVNATLNAEASKSPGLRGRNGDFFIFSRHYCGSPLTGYMPTEELEKVDPYVDLGTAMAISAAAVSTNMGWQTLRRLRFLMTLFNVRLGYWLRRPGSTAIWRPFEGPGPLYFLREMLGAVHEKTAYVNLSDGGHIENLAVYELLRRQCKYIVCVDAGMEPGMECADLMRLQRYAAIDLGIRLHFDPADLTLLPTNFSRAYAILVKIDYAPPSGDSEHQTSSQLGWMLYLKLAITGTEPRYVLDYRRQNPAFPHQTTADQFYDEAQFEAYRALGESAVESLFRREIVGQQTISDLPAWFQALANSILPDNDDVFKPR